MPMKESFDLITTTFGRTRERQYDVVLLPWGATEPHNLHLPYLTDCILSHDIAVDVADTLFKQSGVRCMVMPPVNMGAQNPGQRELPFCVHARYETQKAILTDIVASLYTQGFRRMLIVNGHATGKIEGNRVYLSSPQVDVPIYVRYAWQPFTRANLMGKGGMPVSTFYDRSSFVVESLENFPADEKGIEKGVSACYAGTIGDCLLMAGGCNFPEKPVAEGGKKRYYRGIYMARLDGGNCANV